MIILYFIGLIFLFTFCYLLAKGLEYFLHVKLDIEERNHNLTDPDENE